MAINEVYLGCTGGAGTPTTDGWLTIMHVGNAGMCYQDSIEIDELRHPIFVTARRLLPDTEGAGRFRGAVSAYSEFSPLDCEMTVAYVSDGNVNPAKGVRGGLSGGASSQFVRRHDGTLDPVPGCAEVLSRPGEAMVSVSCGGGGCRPPRERARACRRQRRARRLGQPPAGQDDLRRGPDRRSRAGCRSDADAAQPVNLNGADARGAPLARLSFPCAASPPARIASARRDTSGPLGRSSSSLSTWLRTKWRRRAVPWPSSTSPRRSRLWAATIISQATSSSRRSAASAQLGDGRRRVGGVVLDAVGGMQQSQRRRLGTGADFAFEGADYLLQGGEAGAALTHRRQKSRLVGVGRRHQLEGTLGRDGRDMRQRLRQGLEAQGEARHVEIAIGLQLAVDDDRVVTGMVEFQLDHRDPPRPGGARRAVHGRRAAEGQRVLHTPAVPRSRAADRRRAGRQAVAPPRPGPVPGERH